MTASTPANQSSTVRKMALEHVYCARFFVPNPTPAQLGAAHERLRQVAIHEAGHAVVAAAIALPFEHVDLLPDDAPNLLGRVRYRGYVRLMLRQEYIAYSLAGPIAETCQRSESIEWESEGAYEGDYRDASGAALDEYGTRARARRALMRSEQRLREWLPAHWSAVEAVAAALMCRRWLDDFDVYRIAQANGVVPADDRHRAILLPVHETQRRPSGRLSPTPQSKVK